MSNVSKQSLAYSHHWTVLLCEAMHHAVGRGEHLGILISNITNMSVSDINIRINDINISANEINIAQVKTSFNTRQGLTLRSMNGAEPQKGRQGGPGILCQLCFTLAKFELILCLFCEEYVELNIFLLIN